jgi:hypothetical protein
VKNTFVKMTLLAAVMAAGAFAETVTIHVPFEFNAAGKTLPAGDYTFQEGTAGVMVVSGTAPNSSMLVLMRGGDADRAAKPGVTFSGSRSLSCIQMGDGRKWEVTSEVTRRRRIWRPWTGGETRAASVYFLNLYPIIIFAKRWSVLPVIPTPTPKLNSQFGEKSRSTAGTICCCCSWIGSKFPTGPRLP